MSQPTHPCLPCLLSKPSHLRSPSDTGGHRRIHYEINLFRHISRSVSTKRKQAKICLIRASFAMHITVFTRKTWLNEVDSFRNYCRCYRIWDHCDFIRHLARMMYCARGLPPVFLILPKRGDCRIRKQRCRLLLY